MLAPPLITWLLVSTSPDELSTIPVPATPPFWWPRLLVISTKPGSTLAASADRSTDPREEPDELAGGEAALEGTTTGAGWRAQFPPALWYSLSAQVVACSGCGGTIVGVGGTTTGGTTVGGSTVVGCAGAAGSDDAGPATGLSSPVFAV